jgi:hypothetical protein
MMALSGVLPVQLPLTFITPFHQLLVPSHVPLPSSGLGLAVPFASQVKFAARPAGTRQPKANAMNIQPENKLHRIE